MDETRLRELLSRGETPAVEFKRDRPRQISDRDIHLHIKLARKWNNLALQDSIFAR